MRWVTPLLAATVVGCSGSGSCSSIPAGGNTGNMEKLSMVAPNSFPAGVAVSVPVVVTNNDESTTINNLDYTIDSASNTTGASITFESSSAASCRVIAPKASCTLMANIAATPASHPGSFSVVSSQGSVSSSTKSATASSVLSVGVNIGLVQSASNSAIGADGLSLYYPSSVVGNANASAQVIVTAVVTSANAGSFNTIQLVDGSGNLLNYTTLSANSGNGMTNLTVGSVVTLLVTIPSGSSQLQFKAQTANNGTVVSTATNSNTVIVTNPTAKVGIINILPNYFDLTPSYESQIITLSNSGNGQISNLSFTPSSPLTMLSNNCGTSLAAGATCQYVVKFNKDIPLAGTSGLTVNYNDGTTTQSATATVNYSGVDPVAGLTISGGNNSNFDFTTRTNTPEQSVLVTLTNSGNSNESGFSFNQVEHFTTNINGISNACTPTTVLAPTESCSVNLVYSNSTATPSTTAVVPVSYRFGQKELTATSNIPVTYQTLQSVAILTITPNPATFTGIVNNGVDSSSQTFTVKNTGDATATNITPNISGTNSTSFSIDTTLTLSNRCATSLNESSSCYIRVNFGPVGGSGIGSKSVSLDVSYVPYTTATANTTSAALTGQVSSAQSAIIAQSTATASGFAGEGTLGNPYQVQQVPVGSTGTPSTLTYTIRNNGTVPATSFYIDGTASQGWSYSGCGTQQAPITLNATESCTLTFTLNKANQGTADLLLSSLTMHWIDQDSPSGQTQGMSGTAYTNVYAAPLITLSPESVSITQGESATVTVTLTGGYNVANQTISLGSLSPAESTITYTNNPCSVSSATSTCSISVNTTAQTSANTYNLAITNAGDLGNGALKSTTFTVAVTLPKLIFVTDSPFSGNLGGISGADQKCAAAALTQNHPGTFKAMIVDGVARVAAPNPIDWVLHPTTTYVNIDNQKVNKTNENSVFPWPGESGVTTDDQRVWTGLMADWSSNPNNCRGWTYDGSDEGVTSTGGQASQISSKLIQNDNWRCSASFYRDPFIKLYCVQQ